MAAAMALSRLRNTFVCKSCFQLYMNQIHTGRHLLKWKYTKKAIDPSYTVSMDNRERRPKAPKKFRGLVDMKKIPKDPPFTAYVGNISYDATEEDIQDFFGESIVSVRLKGVDGKPRGYGFVEFETRQALIDALAKDDEMLMNRNIRVDLPGEQQGETGPAGLVPQTHQKPHLGQQNNSKEPWTAVIEDVLSSHQTKNRARQLTEPDFKSYRDFIGYNANIAYSSVLVKIDSHNSIDTVYTALNKKIELRDYSEIKHDGEQNTKMYLIEVKNKLQLNRMAPFVEQRIIGLGDIFLHLGQVRDSEEEKNSLLQQLGQCKDVDAQLQLLYRRMSLPESSLRYQFFATKAVERYIRSNLSLRDAVVECFGSAPSGTALRHVADLDLTMFVPDVRNVQQCLKSLFNHLRTTPIFDKVTNIAHARTPIVHMESPLFHLSMDISVNNIAGALMSNVVFLLGKLHPSFLPLVVFLKYWARVNDLAHGHYRWKSLTSYMLSVLLISHLQQLGQLPPLRDLYQTPDMFEPGSPVGDLETLERIRFKVIPTSSKDREAMFSVRHTDSSISEILCSFFKYYGEFDFRSHLIDVHNGVVVRQTHFFDIYVCNPHEERHNVCRNVTRDSLERFQELCRLSHVALTENKHTKVQIIDSLTEREGSVFKNRNGRKSNTEHYNSLLLHHGLSEKITETDVETHSDKSFDKPVMRDKHWGIQTLLPLFHVEVKLQVQSPGENGNVIEDLFETTVIKTDDPDIEIAVNEKMHVGRLNSLLDLEDLKLAANGSKDSTDVAGDNDGLLKKTGDNKTELKQSTGAEFSDKRGERSGKLDRKRKHKMKKGTMEYLDKVI